MRERAAGGLRRSWFVMSGLILLVATAAACGSIQAQIAPYQTGNGGAVCQTVASDLQNTSSKWAASAWTLGIAGALMVVTGGVVGPGISGDQWYRRGSGVLISTLGASLGAFSAYSYARSDAASTAAVSATRALVEKDDRSAYDRCVEAKALWLGSRIDARQKNPPPTSEK